MSEAFKCDICKKFTEGESCSTETSKQDYTWIKAEFFIPVTWDHNIDLCDECKIEALNNFIEHCSRLSREE